MVPDQALVEIRCLHLMFLITTNKLIFKVTDLGPGRSQWPCLLQLKDPSSFRFFKIDKSCKLKPVWCSLNYFKI